MNQTTTLFLGLAVIILLNSKHAAIGQNTKPQLDFLKIELAKGKVAALSLNEKNLIPNIIVAKNSTIIKFREPKKNFFETFTIRPLDQVVEMKNSYENVSVLLAKTAIILHSYNDEEIKISGPEYHSAILSNKNGDLYARGYGSELGCSLESFSVWSNRYNSVFLMHAIKITYNRSSNIVEIKCENREGKMEIDLASKSIKNGGAEVLNNGIWHSYCGSVTFGDNTVLIAYNGIKLTINLHTKPYSLIMTSLHANLTETPTSASLECEVGKINIEKKNGTMKFLKLSSINGEMGLKNQVIFNDRHETIHSAYTTIEKSQKNEETSQLIRGMYGTMKLH